MGNAGGGEVREEAVGSRSRQAARTPAPRDEAENTDELIQGTVLKQVELGPELRGPAPYETPHLTPYLTPHLTPPESASQCRLLTAVVESEPAQPGRGLDSTTSRDRPCRCRGLSMSRSEWSASRASGAGRVRQVNGRTVSPDENIRTATRYGSRLRRCRFLEPGVELRAR